MRLDDQKVKEISTTLATSINPIFSPLLQSNNQILQDTDVSELGDWYEQAKQGKDNLLSKVAYSLVGNIMTLLPQQIVQLSIEDIAIDTTSPQLGTKFSPTFSKSISPFVEIQLWINGVKAKGMRFTFEVNFDGKFQDMEVKARNGITELCLGKLESNVTASLAKILGVQLNEPREIGSKKIILDLSKQCISI